jgi:Right handed beta helix region
MARVAMFGKLVRRVLLGPVVVYACSGGAGSGQGSLPDAGAGAPASQGGSGGVGGAGGSAGVSGGIAGMGGTAGVSSGGGSMDCDAGMPPMPTGTTLEVTPPETLGDALAGAAAGDRIVLHEGGYQNEAFADLSFESHVFIEAAPGETVTIPGATFRHCDHISIRGIVFEGTVELDGSSDFTFESVTLDGGDSSEAALHIQGQGSDGASHHVRVEDSVVQGGGRTVFVLGRFAASDEWNHHISFVKNVLSCGQNTCFQLSGARDMLIEDNVINGTDTSGVLTAGATRITIARNRFLGMSGSSPAATQIATPGAEWDNYAGVENMISSAIVIANNVLEGWSTGVQLDAATDIAIVYNTIADGTGIRFNHRTPHDQSNNVILDGNSDIRVWNNIMETISIATDEERPAFESNNLVWGDGGGGMNLVTDPPEFADADFNLTPQSPGIDGALVNAETPLVDFAGQVRDGGPDIGARDHDAAAPSCP